MPYRLSQMRIEELTAPAHGFVQSSVKLGSKEIPTGVPTTVRVSVSQEFPLPDKAKGIFFDGRVIIVSFGAKGTLIAELTEAEQYEARLFLKHESADAQDDYQLSRVALHACPSRTGLPTFVLQPANSCNESCLGASIHWSAT